ncbi:MAG TPA: LptF/LptG family permease, partial [Chitinophagaceae bacterium]
MFKKLDKLIIKAFIGPFAATFFITLLVLVMQFFWLWIDDFVGKGLSAGVILEFIWYQSAALVPLALPLAVLLSSLMTFGNLGESYELVAVKSAGISLLRFMRPLFFVVLGISGIAFLFSNNIIPVAVLKSRTLLGDIVYAKPAFDLKEGVFYDKLTGFAIKVGEKESNDSVIRDIIIYEQSGGLQDNFIVASHGVMSVSENKRFLQFDLKNGWRYQERGRPTGGTEFIRLGFKEYKKQFDLSAL